MCIFQGINNYQQSRIILIIITIFVVKMYKFEAEVIEVEKPKNSGICIIDFLLSKYLLFIIIFRA